MAEHELTKALRAELPELGWPCTECAGRFTVTIQEVSPLEVAYYQPGAVRCKIRVDHGDLVVPILLSLTDMGVEGTVAFLEGITNDRKLFPV